MVDVKKAVQKRLIFFVLTLFLCSFFIVEYLSNKLFPLFLEYGEYQCANVFNGIFSYVVEEQVDDYVVDKAIVKESGEFVSVDYNVDVLTSITCNIIKRSQEILYGLENGSIDKIILKNIDSSLLDYSFLSGLVYEVPIGAVSNNFLVRNIGMKIPLKYQLVGNVSAEIVSTIEEYGINGVLIKVSVRVKATSKIILPLISEEYEFVSDVPLVIQLIQGAIPDYYLGTSVIGGVN